MYQRENNARAGRGGPDWLGTVSPEVRARHAAARVRQALADAPAGFSFDGAQLRTALAVTLADPLAEGERCFALGWLHWLAGEPGPAEPLLTRATELLPAGSPELARAKRGQAAEALDLFGQAQAGFYPPPALQAWEALLRQRLEGTPAALPAASPLSSAACALIDGQQSRGEPAKAAAALQVAQTSAVLRPYARYGLACLGQEDFAAVLADLPGTFLAPRCRLWLTLARFCRREAPASELLSAVPQADAAR